MPSTFSPKCSYFLYLTSQLIFCLNFLLTRLSIDFFRTHLRSYFTLSKTNRFKLSLKSTLTLFVVLFIFFSFISRDIIVIGLQMLQILNIYLWQAAHCALQTAQSTLRTAPAPAKAPTSAPVHFVLHIKQCNVHCTPYIYTKCCTFNTSHCKHLKSA